MLRVHKKYRLYLAFAVIALLLVYATALDAADLYLVRFNAGTRENGCITLTWHDQAIFFNNGSGPATIRVLGVSLGQPFPTNAPSSFVVPAGSAVSLEDGLGRAWSSVAVLYIMHLDVPPGVRVAGRNEVYIQNGCIAGPPVAGALGQVSMPVFTTLAAAGAPQVHLGTDLGEFASRTNVGIYNAGDVVAQAHIELRRLCDNTVIDTRTVFVPAGATIQVGPLASGASICTPSSRSPWLRYTVVTVDQPSLTFISNVRETPQANINAIGFMPQVDLSMGSTGIQY